MEIQKTLTEHKLFIVGMSAGFAGTDAHEILLGHPGDTPNELEDEAWYMGVAHAEMYGVYHEEDDEGDNYSDNIEGYIEAEYTPETAHKLDGKRSGGGSFASDFIHELKLHNVEVPNWLYEQERR